jgi:hypothetical protein
VTDSLPAQRNSRRVALAGRVVGSVAGILSCACAVSYFVDCARLYDLAQFVTADAVDPTCRVLKLLDWVHDIEGTRENGQYFALSGLRATPLQVVAAGGDCADKSRLLSAMLRETGIPATMLVCYHRRTGLPTHTVVEAKVGPDEYMVVDPAYGLTFPKAGSCGYHGLLELRASPTIVDERVRTIVASAPRTSPIHAYNPESAAYDYASTINWDKNLLTASVRDLAKWWLGDSIYRMSRPIVLEEPKLFVGAMLGVMGGFIVAATHIFGAWLSHKRIPVALSGVPACGH